MALIHLDEPAPVPVPATRRITMGAAELLVLQRSLPEMTLPDDIRVEVSEAAADLAGTDLDELIAEAGSRLRDSGVLGPEGDPVDAVAANLQSVVAAPRRVRTTYGGPGIDVLAYHWTGPTLGGSLVRDGEKFELSMFDSRGFGNEMLRLLPEQDVVEAGRAEITLPLEEFQTLTVIEDEIAPEQVDPVAGFLGLEPAVVRAVQTWADGFRGALHCTVSDTDEHRPPKALVWVCERTGWWSAAPLTRADGNRSVTLAPRERRELTADLGYLTLGAWT